MPTPRPRRRFRRELALAAGIALCASALAASPAAADHREYKTLDLLKAISGNHTITGQHNREPNADPLKWTRVATELTGKTPGLWGGDFLFQPDEIANRQTMVDEAIRQWNAGSVVALTWHTCPPDQTSCWWDADGVLSHMSDARWKELVTEGTALNTAYKRRMDEIAIYLRQLKDAGVEVLWRPVHEMNEGWSWWGGRPGGQGSRKLYKITHDYLTKDKGLDNLIWVWNVKDVAGGASHLADYYPGTAYVDVTSLDLWVNGEPPQDYYDALKALAPKKPLALAEVGRVPSPEVLAAQPDWSYFMVWAEWLKDPAYNTDAEVQRTYWSERGLVRGEFDLGGTTGDDLARRRTVTASSQADSASGPALAVDGRPGTSWRSGPQEQQSLTVDLGAERTVNLVTLTWGADHATGYQVQTSTDGLTWTTRYEQYSGDGGTDVITLPATSARHLKIYAFKSSANNGYALAEVDVRGR